VTETSNGNALSWLVSRSDRFTARLDGGFERMEGRFGAWGGSLVFGLALMVAAALYCAPAKELINHGVLYGDFSRDPLQQSLTSPISLRPLAPVVAYLLFLRGQAFMALPLLAGVVFLALVMRTFRKRGFSGSECIGMASLLAFTSPVLFTLHFAGYVDLVSYLFIGLAVAYVGSDLVVAACIGLALLNHDSNLFILPWLVFHVARQRPSWARRFRLFVALGAAFLIVALVRNAIAQRAPIMWAPSFYLNLAYLRENALLNVRGAWLGLFMVFKLGWVIPLFAASDLAAKKRRIELFDLGFAVFCGVATLFITSDVSRLPSMAFPAVLGGAALLRKSALKPPQFTRALWLVVFVNLLVPQYYVGQSRPIVFYPLPVALVLKACGYNPWDDWLGLRQMHFSQE
jgi:hypothetical protein